ncbi:MAG: hypothetical protein AB1327_10730 [Bacillota bacterium]|uniref:hypothetical protein n=1 Tax=Desulforudis sp. DRI-14 TaxID=3459793 RepID=UPI003471C8DD
MKNKASGISSRRLFAVINRPSVTFSSGFSLAKKAFGKDLPICYHRMRLIWPRISPVRVLSKDGVSGILMFLTGKGRTKSRAKSASGAELLTGEGVA